MNKGQASAVKDALLAEARSQGRRAGQLGTAFALCPFPDGSPEWENWTEGWRQANAERFSRYGDRAVVLTCLLAPIFVMLMGG